MSVFSKPLTKFRDQVAKARQYGPTDASRYVSSILSKVVDNTLDVGGGLVILAFHDPAEDVDDPDAILRYLTLYKNHKVNVVLAGGTYTSEQRFACLIQLGIIPDDSELGVPYRNVTFYAEDADLPTVEYDIFLHCSPISVANFGYAVKSMKPGGKCVLVGSTVDGGFTNTINQRYTDKNMTADKDQWNADVSALKSKQCKVIGLDADLSRNVKFLNPASLPPEHPFSSQSILAMTSKKLRGLYGEVALRFLASRPTHLPSAVAQRINEANSRVFADTLSTLVDDVTEDDLTVFLEYETVCKSLGMTQEAIDPAIVCFGLSARLGVKYATPGVFSIDPKDHAGREAISCISNVDEVMPRFMAAASYLIPAYDSVAGALAFLSDEQLALAGICV